MSALRASPVDSVSMLALGQTIHAQLLHKTLRPRTHLGGGAVRQVQADRAEEAGEHHVAHRKTPAMEVLEVVRNDTDHAC